MEAGFQHYEVSAYARRQARCVHNLNYWRFGDYLGLGAGAHGKITDPLRQVIQRSIKQKHPRRYLFGLASGDFVMNERRVSPEEAVLEFMMNALRLVEGFPVELFPATTGLPLSVIKEPLRQAETRELIVCSASRICPTAFGRRFLDDLLTLFVSAEMAWECHTGETPPDDP